MKTTRPHIILEQQPSQGTPTSRLLAISRDDAWRVSTEINRLNYKQQQIINQR